MAFRQFTATNAAQQVTAYFKPRLAVTVRSLGAAQVFISHDRVDIVATGFPLNTGEFISFIERDGDDPTLAIYAQTAAGTADLRIHESYERIPKE